MDPIIKVAVGRDEPQLVSVHQDVLCKSSEFFKRTLKPEWTSLRDDPHTIDMSDASLDIVKVYVNWLYSGNLPIPLFHRADEDTSTKIAEEAEKVYVTLAKAYGFGEEVIDIMFKDAVMGIFIPAKRASGFNPGPVGVSIIYESTSIGSPLRRLIADVIAREAFEDSATAVGWMTYIDGYPREALADAMKIMIKVRARPTGIHPYYVSTQSYREVKEEVCDSDSGDTSVSSIERLFLKGGAAT